MTPDEIVEAVARAIFRAHEERGEVAIYDETVARAAILATLRAIREANEPLLDCGIAATVSWQRIEGSQATVNRQKMRLRFRAMIDAKIKEFSDD